MATEKQVAEAACLMHPALLALRDYLEAGRVPVPALGICPNIDRILTRDMGRLDLAASSAAHKVLRDLFARWPHVAMVPGEPSFPNSTYPVDGYTGYATERLVDRLWRNTRRLELLDWLIQETADQAHKVCQDMPQGEQQE